MPPHCQLEGDHTRAVTVQTGTAERHVARVVFEVQCARAEKIAFSETSSGGTNRVVVAHADGSRPREVVDGMQPSWSPDGAELVYARPMCSYYYGWPESVGLARLAPADGQPVPFSITNEGHDSEPAWSPQGDRIAFSRIRAGRTGLWVVAPTGGTAAGPGRAASTGPSPAS